MLYNLNSRELINEKHREYHYLDYSCPVCLHTVTLYRTKQHCTSLLHVNHIKYCDDQKQTCMFNSHSTNTIQHNHIDEEVRVYMGP